MTVPIEYEQASKKFYEFLVDLRDTAGLWSTHVTYTMTQGVFQVFRRRLSTSEAIDFANLLPVGLRALFVADWNVHESKKPFESPATMCDEVKQLRAAHNFSTDNAIQDVATVLRRHINQQTLDDMLLRFPKGAQDFWKPSRPNEE